METALIAVTIVAVAAIAALAAVAFRLAGENARLLEQQSAAVDVSLRLLASKDYSHFRTAEVAAERAKVVPFGLGGDPIAQIRSIEAERERAARATAEANPYGIGP